MTNFYDIYGILSIGIEFNGRGNQIKELLKPYQISDSQKNYVELILSHIHKKTNHPISEEISKSYKGIPYKLELLKDKMGNPKKIFFSTPLFMDFLVLRMILIPCIKAKLIEAGGFPIFGAVFSYNDKIAYVDLMKVSDLEIRIKATIKKKSADFDPIKIGVGVIARSLLSQIRPILAISPISVA